MTRLLTVFTLATLIAAPAPGQVIHQFDGTGTGSGFGTAVAGVGDVDGDGFDDVAVGAPFESGSGTQSGRVYVLSGATGAALHTFDGGGVGETFGRVVAAAGDVDADGVPDIVAGSAFSNTAASEGGCAKVFSGATGTVLHTVDGSFLEREGTSVAGAGDVDADGFDDFMVGATGVTVAAGRVRVFSGRTGAVLFTFTGGSPGDDFGQSCRSAGDVDADGVPDIVTGAPGSGGGQGAVQVFSGADGTVLHTFPGSAFESFGAAVSGAGDVDGDGFDDIVAGGPTAGSGLIRIFSGRDGSTLYSIPGLAVGDRFGAAVSGAGDIDRDGFDDVFVGAPTVGRRGRAEIISGFDGARQLPIQEDDFGDRRGAAVDLAGDVDGDGRLDLIVGTPNDDTGNGAGTGSALVLTAFVARRFTGSAEDFVLQSTTDRLAPFGLDVNSKPASPGDVVSLHFESPQGTFVGNVPLFIVQPFANGSPPGSPLGFPEVHVNPAVLPLPILVFDPYTGPFGVQTLPPQGISLTLGTVPPFLVGSSLMMQALVLSGTSANMIFAATDGHEIEVVP